MKVGQFTYLGVIAVPGHSGALLVNYPSDDPNRRWTKALVSYSKKEPVLIEYR